MNMCCNGILQQCMEASHYNNILSDQAIQSILEHMNIRKADLKGDF